MKQWGKVSAGVLASLMFLSTTALTAVEAKAALKQVRQIAVQQGALSGVVVDGEGRGLAKAVVDVRDSNGDVVVLGVTKADGTFTLASVPVGEYLLSVNGEFTYSLKVAKDAEAATVSLVVPLRPAYSAGEGEDLSLTQLGLLFGAGAGAAIIFKKDDCP